MGEAEVAQRMWEWWERGRVASLVLEECGLEP